MTQIDELLRQTANAVGRDEDTERRAIGVARSALSTAIAAAAAEDLSDAQSKRQNRRMRLPRRATWLALPLAATAAVVIVALVPSGGNVIQPPTAAAAILGRAADAVLAAPPGQLAPGQYWYEEDQATYLDGSDLGSGQSGSLFAYVSEDERWWVNNQHYLHREQLESVRATQPVTTASQRAALALLGEKQSPLSGSGPGYDLPLSYTQMLQAPSDPNALADYILNMTSARPTAQWRTTALLEEIGLIVVEPRIPAQMLADVYRLAATLEGVRVIGTVTDALGRQALAIGFTIDDQHKAYELLFDPQTYELLDERDTNSVTGQLEENVAYIASGVVPQIGVTPAQQQSTTTPAAATTTPASTDTPEPTTATPVPTTATPVPTTATPAPTTTTPGATATSLTATTATTTTTQGSIATTPPLSTTSSSTSTTPGLTG